MKSLDKNWFLNEPLDFEYKQYILLDYIQGVRKYFLQNKLYPVLSDLISHYKKVLEYQNGLKRNLNYSFSKKLIGIDWEGKEIIYEPEVVSDFVEPCPIEEIVEFSIPIFQEVIDEGKAIYDFFNENFRFRKIGNQPLNTSEGYILVRMNKQVFAYRYKLLQFGEYKRLIDLLEVGMFKSTLSNTVENIKSKLEKKYDIKNSATLFVDVDFDTPMEETIIPIIKRKGCFRY